MNANAYERLWLYNEELFINCLYIFHENVVKCYDNLLPLNVIEWKHSKSLYIELSGTRLIEHVSILQ
jgi:hypothetical protein